MDLFSARMGCQVEHPLYGIDLAALVRAGLGPHAIAGSASPGATRFNSYSSDTAIPLWTRAQHTFDPPTSQLTSSPMHSGRRAAMT